ncbi:MAG TPA: SAM-dependent chlorinase/fluorinase [Polyangia bacterium]|nr:SAM-dependent chlorinase/fluorinase [Polyangia bacterium]
MAIVTFTTDFGTHDGYVGALKGVVLSLAPGATLVDIAHGVPAHDVAAGAVALAQAAPLFPPGTIHVAVVDPGVGGARADIVVAAGGSLYVGPDNGVLSLAARAPRQIHRIDAPGFRREPVSPTFHGRDVFAPAAGRLAAGAPIAEAGPAMPAMVELGAPPLHRRDGALEGEVIHVDGFGNLITSLPAEAVARMGAEASVEVEGTAGRFEPQLGRTFSDVEPGALIAYIGSGGQLEIARRDGSASQRLGAERGTIVRLRSGTP